MAVTTVFDGTLAAGAQGAWVAIPASRAYGIQSAPGYVNFQFSIDGANPIRLNSAYIKGANGSNLPESGIAYSVVDFPAAFMRADNSQGTSAVTGKLTVQVA